MFFPCAELLPMPRLFTVVFYFAEAKQTTQFHKHDGPTLSHSTGAGSRSAPVACSKTMSCVALLKTWEPCHMWQPSCRNFTASIFSDLESSKTLFSHQLATQTSLQKHTYPVLLGPTHPILRNQRRRRKRQYSSTECWEQTCDGKGASERCMSCSVCARLPVCYAWCQATLFMYS